MPAGLSESHIEEAALAWFEGLGYDVAHGPDIGPEGSTPERAAYSEVLLEKRLVAAIERLNPTLSAAARAEALQKVKLTQFVEPIRENARLHDYLVAGVPIEVRRKDGSLSGELVRLIDYDDDDGTANDWLVVNQFTVIENKANRRPDLVVFVNGLPLAVIELKNPGDENATLDGAYNQLQTYKGQIPSLFRTNALLVISDGLRARVGSLTANFERFMPWRTLDGKVMAPAGVPELQVLIEGMFERKRLLDLLRAFVAFGETGGGLVKVLAGYHQYFAVKLALASTIRALARSDKSSHGVGVAEAPDVYGLPNAARQPVGDKRAGVIWHTQGSGKSLLMTFYAGQLIRHPALENPTIVVVTDRNDLDNQLYTTFSQFRDLLRQTPEQAEDRQDLRRKLERAAGGVVFTTIQKFTPEDGSADYPLLSNRANIVVIVDEAHRSQYGFGAKIDKKTGALSYGFAKYLREALPFASCIGFTGTPIEKADTNTAQVFGDYIDVYDISRAVEDGATVPIYYESRLARIELPDDEKPKIDAEIAELTEEVSEIEEEKLGRKLASIEGVVGSEKRLALIAQDLVDHAEARFAALDGKGMIVCMSRRICVALYEAIIKIRPDWHHEDDNLGAIKIVMTGAASDPESWQKHIGKQPKVRRELMAKRAKDPKDALKLVIVRDMWLTGFDAPCMHTMYIDKPMKGHGLMQAIARVNRVFKDKPGGLVVDYIGIAQHLKAALAQYSGPDRDKTGIDEKQAEKVLKEKLEVVRGIFKPGLKSGYDYRAALAVDALPQTRLAILAGALDWVLTLQQADAAKEKTEEGKKRAHRRFVDAVAALSQAYALCAASDLARSIREEVGFFQTLRAALVKNADPGGKSATQLEFAIQQIVSRSVLSIEIVDIVKAAGMASPDISILSDEFLAEVRDHDKKNLALEALRRLINGEVRAQSRRNVIQAKAFSERLEAAIARYHANAITTVEVLEELIKLAQEIRAARQRGEETGLSDEEIAFYDALADNQSAREVMGEPALRVIATELVNNIRQNVTVDWMHREAARARLRVLVKKILRRHGYPPDLENLAVQKVLQQAEVLSAELAE